MENKTMRETKEIVTEILFDRAERTAGDVLEKASKENQKELTVDEMVDVIGDMVFTTAVLLVRLRVSVESLKKYKYNNQESDL